MNYKNTYTGSKVKNQFTSYLLKSIRGKRRDYLEKKYKIASMEEIIEDFSKMGRGISYDEQLDEHDREQTLMDEAKGNFPEWHQMANDQLVEALLMLCEEERELIYQHVFEELTFDEMSLKNGLSADRCKGVYYYAIRKIRKVMRG